MTGLGGWLAAKYNILDKHATADMIKAWAAQTQAQSQAGTVDPAQAMALRAGGYKSAQEGGMVKPTAQAAIGQTEADTSAKIAETAWRKEHPEGWSNAPAPAAPAPAATSPVATAVPNATGYTPGIGGAVHLTPDTLPTPRPVSYAGPGYGALGIGNPLVSGSGPGYMALGTGNPLQHFAGGTADIEPNFGAWGAPGTSAPAPAVTNTGAGMVPIGAAAGTHFPQAGYFSGAPVPSGATAYAAPGPTPATSSMGGIDKPVQGTTGRFHDTDWQTNQQAPNVIQPVPGAEDQGGYPRYEHDQYGLSTPLGHSRTTGGEGDWGEYKSKPIVTSIDGQRPTRLPGRKGYGWEDPSRVWAAGGGDMPDMKGYKKGTSKVPAAKGGKDHAPAKGGKGMVDAKLAPGEAVLTPHAADRLGRDNISLLNALAHHGALHTQGPHLGGMPHAPMPQSIGAVQGMPPPMAGPPQAGPGPQAPAGPPGYAGGTSKVQQKTLQAAGDNGTKMGKETVLPGAEYATQGYAKGTSQVQNDDNIGKPVKLSNTKGGGKQPPDLSLAKGTSKVPGKPTHPSKDTVSAELPPGGAVLTNDAANHVGRGLIAHLNAMHGGMAKPGYAGGTSDIEASNAFHAAHDAAMRAPAPAPVTPEPQNLWQRAQSGYQSLNTALTPPRQ